MRPCWFNDVSLPFVPEERERETMNNTSTSYAVLAIYASSRGCYVATKHMHGRSENAQEGALPEAARASCEIARVLKEHDGPRPQGFGRAAGS